ncbi:MAG: hypothetical protein U0470_00785 [Anaerolineae bacterium]
MTIQLTFRPSALLTALAALTAAAMIAFLADAPRPGHGYLIGCACPAGLFTLPGT